MAMLIASLLDWAGSTDGVELKLVAHCLAARHTACSICCASAETSSRRHSKPADAANSRPASFLQLDCILARSSSSSVHACPHNEASVHACPHNEAPVHACPHNEACDANAPMLLHDTQAIGRDWHNVGLGTTARQGHTSAATLELDDRLLRTLGLRCGAAYDRNR